MPLETYFIKTCHFVHHHPWCDICHFKERGHVLSTAEKQGTRAKKTRNQSKNQDVNLFLRVWPRLDSCAARDKEAEESQSEGNFLLPMMQQKTKYSLLSAGPTLSPSGDSHKGRNLPLQYLSPRLEFSFHTSTFKHPSESYCLAVKRETKRNVKCDGGFFTLSLLLRQEVGVHPTHGADKGDSCLQGLFTRRDCSFQRITGLFSFLTMVLFSGLCSAIELILWQTMLQGFLSAKIHILTCIHLCSNQREWLRCKIFNFNL